MIHWRPCSQGFLGTRPRRASETGRMATRQSGGSSGTNRPYHGVPSDRPRKAPRFFHQSPGDRIVGRLDLGEPVEGWPGLGMIVQETHKARDGVLELGKVVG